MKNSKRIIALALVMFTFIANMNFNAIASAAPIAQNQEFVEIYDGVSPEEPGIDTTYGTSKPSNVWDVTKSGRYNFSGKSQQQDMYTNYKFTGKDSYTVSVTNHGKYNLNVKVKTLTNTYSSNTLAPGTTSTFSVSGMKKISEPYIWFGGSYQDFSGYIQ